MSACLLPRYQMGYNYIRAVSRTVGYCLYGTLLLRPRWTARPVQIRAHHHLDVYTDINYVEHNNNNMTSRLLR